LGHPPGIVNNSAPTPCRVAANASAATTMQWRPPGRHRGTPSVPRHTIGHEP
jgi:hypothetical protein